MVFSFRTKLPRIGLPREVLHQPNSSPSPIREMSLEEISIGSELKDSFKETSKWVANGINWLDDLDDFYKERAAIEQEYSVRLQELCKRHYEKKAKNSSHLSVGDEPKITPGSLECASVVLWNEVLTQTEAIAKERSRLAGDFLAKLCSNLQKLLVKLNKILRHVTSINDYLLAEKKNTEDDVAKAKKAYDNLCQSTENARQKTEKSQSEKYQQKLEEKKVDMNVGKNNYLIKISVANSLKDKYYFQDLPEVLDYLQDLNETRVGILNKLIKNACIFERSSNDKVKEILSAIDVTADQNNPKLDTAMYIKHNVSQWNEPNDFVFIPCSFWHDDETLITKEPELTDLKKRLNAALTTYSSYKQSTLSCKQKFEEAAQARKESEDALTMKFDTKLDDVLYLLEKFMKEDSSRVKSEVEIEIIQNFAGDKDLSYVEQKKEKKSRFGLFKLSKKSPTEKSQQSNDTQSIYTVTSNVTSGSGGGGLGGIFSLRRKKTTTSFESKPNASALYAYDASGDDEVSVMAGETLFVTQPDDGSGWTQVRKSNEEIGLVPTSYLQIDLQAEDGGKRKGPSVAPKRGAKKVEYVEALYDYIAEEENELSILAGDKIVLVQEDTDGSGWTEGELNSQRGLFPTSYVTKI